MITDLGLHGVPVQNGCKGLSRLICSLRGVCYRDENLKQKMPRLVLYVSFEIYLKFCQNIYNSILHNWRQSNTMLSRRICCCIKRDSAYSVIAINTCKLFTKR